MKYWLVNHCMTENHIENLFEEIPRMADKKKVTNFIGAVFNGKDSKRC